jgi:protein-S-isoprenylcysteine O-methyltransferase Ste14
VSGNKSTEKFVVSLRVPLIGPIVSIAPRQEETVAQGIIRSEIQVRQRARKRRIVLMALLGLPLLFCVGSAWSAPTSEAIEALGAWLMIAAVFGRTWCTLYIGGKKKTEVVSTGPYSLVRHPLYTFSLIGLAGLGAQTGSLVIAALSPLMVGWPLAAVARHEESLLAESFGDEYRHYAARTPMFLPRLTPGQGLWQEADTLVVNPALVRRTFIEASLLLLAIPAGEIIQWLQRNDIVSILLTLP